MRGRVFYMAKLVEEYREKEAQKVYSPVYSPMGVSVY